MKGGIYSAFFILSNTEAGIKAVYFQINCSLKASKKIGKLGS
jgi:hypothetical protein